ncbi:hypothetical protein H8356DRAFT_1339017 [Neocallimastix lanati (nom. inval.)]|nr:hypothetical protein H8356DRAFT_1339017 [Neocallimastix sp. JGI-2020a]
MGFLNGVPKKNSSKWDSLTSKSAKVFNLAKSNLAKCPTPDRAFGNVGEMQLGEMQHFNTTPLGEMQPDEMQFGEMQLSRIIHYI